MAVLRFHKIVSTPHRIPFIKGDGVGPLVMEAARRCLEATGAALEWIPLEAGLTLVEKSERIISDEVVEAIRKYGVAFAGPLEWPQGAMLNSLGPTLLSALDLHSYIRWIRTYPGFPTLFPSINMTVLWDTPLMSGRTDSHGYGLVTTRMIRSWMNFLAGIRVGQITMERDPMLGENIPRTITRGFEEALHRGKSRITLAVPDSGGKVSDYWNLSVQKIFEEFPGDCRLEILPLPALQVLIEQRPDAYDILLIPHELSRDLMLTAGRLAGGFKVIAGAMVGPEAAVFQPVHAPLSRARGYQEGWADMNPLGAILTGLQMLRFLGEDQAALALEKAVAQVVAQGDAVTPDFRRPEDPRRSVDALAMADAIVAAMGVPQN